MHLFYLKLYTRNTQIRKSHSENPLLSPLIKTLPRLSLSSNFTPKTYITCITNILSTHSYHRHSTHLLPIYIIDLTIQCTIVIAISRRRPLRLGENTLLTNYWFDHDPRITCKTDLSHVHRKYPGSFYTPNIFSFSVHIMKNTLRQHFYPKSRHISHGTSYFNTLP